MLRLVPVLLCWFFAATSLAQGEAASEVPPGAGSTGDSEKTNGGGASTGDAPLGNENVAVHAVERKPYANEGRLEAALFPLSAQVNGKFTNQLGLGAMLAWHLQENIAFQITPFYNYIASDSGFSEELINKGRLQPQAATSLVTTAGVTAGVEVTPIYAKFAFYRESLIHFSLVLNAGVGAGLTRVELTPPVSCSAASPSCSALQASYGDTGVKFMGSLGAGFRVYLSERVTLRLEVRDLVYTAQVTSINGCNVQDLTNLNGGQSLPAGSSCNASAFPAGLGGKQVALSMLQQSSSDVLNDVLFFGGVSFIF